MSRPVFRLPRNARMHAGPELEGILMTITTSTKEWLSVADLCELLGIGRTLAYQLVAEHAIPAVRIGRAIRVHKADVEQWLEQNRY